MSGMSDAGTKSIDLFVREIDLPGLTFGQLVPSQQAACQIIEHSLRRNSKFRGHTLNREAAVGPAHGIRAGRVESRDPLPQSVAIHVVMVAANTSLHAVLANRAGLPYDFEPHLPGGPFLIEDNFAHDEAQDALPVGRRRGGGMPNPWQVLAQGLQICALRRADHERFLRAPSRMFLLDSLDGAQLLFPSPLERARNETILWFDCVILTPCPLGLVASALASKHPLSLELSALFLKLPHRRERNRYLIRRQGIEEGALNERVDRKSPDFLTYRTALLVSIGPAAIDRIVAIRPCVAQAHAPSAKAADRDTLQQRRALARHASMSRFIAGDVVCHSPLVGHELLPADVTRVSGVEANRPVRNRHLDCSRHRSRPASARILLPTTVNVSPSIGRILKNITNPRTIGFSPDHLMRIWSEHRSNWQR